MIQKCLVFFATTTEVKHLIFQTTFGNREMQLEFPISDVGLIDKITKELTKEKKGAPCPFRISITGIVPMK